MELLFAAIPGLLVGYIAGGTAALKNRSSRRWGIPIGCAFGIFLLAAMLVPSQLSKAATVLCGLLCALALVGSLGAMGVLAFLPCLCPCCRTALDSAQWRGKACPQCGSFAQEKKRKQTTGLDAVIMVAGIFFSFFLLGVFLNYPISDVPAIVISFSPLVLACGFVGLRRK